MRAVTVANRAMLAQRRRVPVARKQKDLMAQSSLRVTRTPLVIVGLSLLVGGVLGFVAKAADQSGVNWLADVTTYPALWVVVLVVLARFVPGRVTATVSAAVLFVAMCLSYYATSEIVYGFPTPRFAMIWGVLAVTACPLFVFITSRALRRANPVLGAAALAVAIAVILSDESVIQVWLSLRGLLEASPATRFGQALFDVVCTVGVIAMGRTRWQRILSLAFAIPLSVAAVFVIQDIAFASGLIG